MFFLLWPLFARAPRHWFLEFFLLSAPGVQSVFFFVALRWAPRPFGGARAKKKTPPGWCFFFCSGPVPARGQSKKKTPWVVFFFLLWLRAGAQRGFSFPCLSPGPEQKKKPWVVFFFCCGPARTGVVFFFCCGPARTLTHSLTVGWGDFGKARVVLFFLLRPRRVFLDNNKNVWGTTSGLKRPGGATAKKKNTTSSLVACIG